MGKNFNVYQKRYGKRETQEGRDNKEDVRLPIKEIHLCTENLQRCLWTWQTNCMGTMEGFSRSDRYFYQTITVWRNLNQRFRNNLTFHRSHYDETCPHKNCWQMPQVFIYTDGSCNGKLPTYTRCLAETRLAGDVTVRNMSRLHDTGRS